MWTRKELKQQARGALQRNYWKCTLVAFIMMILGGNWVGNLFSTASASGTSDEVSTAVVEGSFSTEDGEDSIVIDDETFYDAKVTETVMNELERPEIVIGFLVTCIIFIIIFVVAVVIIFAYEILLVCPVIVGARRFMLRSVDGKADVREVAYAFDHSYKNVVKTMFHTEISIFLWSLLFVVPGIYKQYQYRMVEYILAERPDLNYKNVMQMSKDMMQGEKWHAFVLDLSFIPWECVSVLTCGIAHILFVAPYRYLTNAMLYRRLCAVRNGGFAEKREAIGNIS